MGKLQRKEGSVVSLCNIPRRYLVRAFLQYLLHKHYCYPTITASGILKTHFPTTVCYNILLSVLYFIYLLPCGWEHTHHGLQNNCGENRFLHPKWVPQIKLRVLDLAAGTLSHWAILLAPSANILVASHLHEFWPIDQRGSGFQNTDHVQVSWEGWRHKSNFSGLSPLFLKGS